MICTDRLDRLAASCARARGARNHANRRTALPLSVASLLFYINPTTQLLIGVFYFGAAFPLREAFVFGLIWTGLVVYFTTRRGRSAI